VVCANLKIKLIHARPSAAWSRGKIERFFRTVQDDFQSRLRTEPKSPGDILLMVLLMVRVIERVVLL
jgi:transposase InsO family protein